MAAALPALTISISINRPHAEVYGFLANPSNFPAWASGLGGSLSEIDGQWIAQTPHGPLGVRFSEHNPFGVLDHWVVLEQGTEIYIPMRLIENGEASELIFTLFCQPEMSEERFADDAEWVKRDLHALKTLLES